VVPLGPGGPPPPPFGCGLGPSLPGPPAPASPRPFRPVFFGPPWAGPAPPGPPARAKPFSPFSGAHPPPAPRHRRLLARPLGVFLVRGAHLADLCFFVPLVFATPPARFSLFVRPSLGPRPRPWGRFARAAPQSPSLAPLFRPFTHHATPPGHRPTRRPAVLGGPGAGASAVPPVHPFALPAGRPVLFSPRPFLGRRRSHSGSRGLTRPPPTPRGGGPRGFPARSPARRSGPVGPWFPGPSAFWGLGGSCPLPRPFSDLPPCVPARGPFGRGGPRAPFGPVCRPRFLALPCSHGFWHLVVPSPVPAVRPPVFLAGWAPPPAPALGGPLASPLPPFGRRPVRCPAPRPFTPTAFPPPFPFPVVSPPSAIGSDLPSPPDSPRGAPAPAGLARFLPPPFPSVFGPRGPPLPGPRLFGSRWARRSLPEGTGFRVCFRHPLRAYPSPRPPWPPSAAPGVAAGPLAAPFRCTRPPFARY